MAPSMMSNVSTVSNISIAQSVPTVAGMIDQTINLEAVIYSVFRTHSGLMIQCLDISTFNKYMYY